MRCTRSCFTGLEQILDWGNRKPVSAVNSQDSNTRASQCPSPAAVRLGPPCPAHTEEAVPREGSLEALQCPLCLGDAPTGASGKPRCSLISEGRYWLCSRAGTAVTKHSSLPPKDQPELTTTGSPELSIPTAFSSLKSCDTARGCHSPTERAAPALSVGTLRFALAEKSLQSRNYHQSSD